MGKAEDQNKSTLLEYLQLGKTYLNTQERFFSKALTLMDNWGRMLLIVLWTFSVLCFLGIVAFVIWGEILYAFLCLIFTLLCILSSFIYIIKEYKKIDTDLEIKTTKATWERIILNMPIPDVQLRQFRLYLKNIRNQAIQTINEELSNSGKSIIPADLIRINIFLPTPERLQQSGTLWLIIPNELHDNMANSDDRKIKILFHEGLTGRTFTLEEACGAKSKINNNHLDWSKVDLFPERGSSAEWESFALSDEQKNLIGIQLRWIVSFPLKFRVKEKDNTFGVLNIDCRNHEITDEEMRKLAIAIEQSVNQVATELSELPKILITINYKNFNGLKE